MLPRQPTLPSPPPPPADIPMSLQLREWVNSLVGHQKDLVRTLEADNSRSNVEVNGFIEVGSTIASGATIKLTGRIHSVSGTETISTITPPPNGFSGLAILLALGAWKLDTAGNVAKASQPAVGTALFLVYNPTTEKWYVN